MEYPVAVGYTPDEIARDEYSSQEAPSPREAARRALKSMYDQGQKYEPDTCIVTVLVDGEPEVFEVMAERVVETYVL
jgi:hypothetical protein